MQPAWSLMMSARCLMVCATLEIGPTALRRWVDQVRKERQGQPVKGTKAITDEQREIQNLKAKI
ncbi:transposase, partial [Pseudomonas sp. MAFF 730085]|nr:transposase [Pseudomonas kitaguniensis]